MAQLQNTTVNGTLAATTFSGPGANITGFNSSLITAQVPATIATSGTVINRTEYSNASAFQAGNQANYTAYSFTINKLVNSSNLWIRGMLSGNGNDQGYNGTSYTAGFAQGLCWFIGIDGVNDYTGINFMPTDGQGAGVQFSQLRTGISSGTRTITIGWSSNNGSAVLNVYTINPNGSSGSGADSRNQQNGSVINVWELQA
jgi:hypothetical protein